MLSTVEQLELSAHRAHLRVGTTLANIRERIELLEKPRVNVQERQQTEQQARVDEFWRLSQAEQDAHPDMTASACRQRVLLQHPEFKTIYPKVQ